MDISRFATDNGVVSQEKYYELFNEYKASCNRLIPLGERYVLNEDASLLGKTYTKGTTFVIDIADGYNMQRIDLVICIGADCLVYDDVDSLLGDLEDLNFDVYKQDVVSKLKYIEEETLRLFKMMSVNNVELLLSIKDNFKKLKSFAEIADYKVKFNKED